MAARLEQYEALRRQALEPRPADLPGHNRLELALIERQGLAAWAVHASKSAAPTDLQALELREAAPPPQDLVLALVDLVLGDRQEVQDGRSD